MSCVPQEAHTDTGVCTASQARDGRRYGGQIRYVVVILHNKWIKDADPNLIVA